MRLFFILIILAITSKGFSQSEKNKSAEINYKTIIKDHNGNIIEYLEYIELTNSGNWIPVENKDAKGKVISVQLRRTTQTEKDEIIKKYVHGEDSDLVGQKSPKFRMKDLDGNIISSAKTAGKVVVLNFWFSQCRPCILEFPALNNIYAKYKDHEDVVFAAITFDEKEKTISFLKKYPFKYPVVADAQEICDLFIERSYPVNIVINKAGVYEAYAIGGFPETGLEKSIQSALSKN